MTNGFPKLEGSKMKLTRKQWGVLGGIMLGLILMGILVALS